jgi:hypothetical protein
MRELEPTVCALLAAAQQESKAQLDTGWVDTVFKVGGWILQTKELLDAVEIGKPFTVTACPDPNTYTLELPQQMLCNPTVNEDRLKPFNERVGAPPAPGQVSAPGQEGEQEVELLLNRKEKRGLRDTSPGGAVTRRRRMSGCWRRIWLPEESGRVLGGSHGAMPPGGPAQARRPLARRHPGQRCAVRPRPTAGTGRPRAGHRGRAGRRGRGAGRSSGAVLVAAIHRRLPVGPWAGRVRP